MSSYKKTLINKLIMLLIVIFVIGWSVLYFHELHVKKTALKEAELLNDGFSYSLDEDVTDTDGKISGWIIKQGTSIGTCSINVILKECDSMNAYILPTQVDKRADVTTLISDGNNYDYSGFEAQIGNIDKDKQYVLCFKLEINNIVYYYNTQQMITL